MVKMSVAPLILLPALPPNNNMHSVNCYLIDSSSWAVLNFSQPTLEPSLALAISSQLITISLPLQLHGNCYLNLQPLLDIKFLQFLGLCPPLSDSKPFQCALHCLSPSQYLNICIFTSLLCSATTQLYFEMMLMKPLQLSYFELGQQFHGSQKF